jgi:hypothetical protein
MTDAVQNKFFRSLDLKNPNRKTWITSILILLPGLLHGLPCEARFRHVDALRVDPEDETNRETYNDRISYQSPYSWTKEWLEKAVGYRASAGSLNNRRFLFFQDIKVQTDKELPWFFSYEQNQADDMVEQITYREIRLGRSLAEGWRLDMLTDGDIYKEFGDLGISLVSLLGERRQVELFFWSVDQYYNQKKVEGENSYDKTPYTFGAKGSFAVAGTQTISFRLEHDTPLDWNLASRGTRYHYQLSQAGLSWSMPLAGNEAAHANHDHRSVSAALNWQSKKETLWPTPGHVQEILTQTRMGDRDDLLAWGRLERTTFDVDLHVHWPTSSLTYDGGIWGIYRRALTTRPALPQNAESPTVLGPQSALEEEDYLFLRREQALYGTISGPSSMRDMTWHQGFTANYSQITFTPDRDGLELKYNLGYEFRANSHTKVFLNSTWDLDQLRQDFPYRERSFRPWGGGNIQFLATF